MYLVSLLCITDADVSKFKTLSDRSYYRWDKTNLIYHVSLFNSLIWINDMHANWCSEYEIVLELFQYIYVYPALKKANVYIYINRLTHYRSSERIMRGLKPSLFPCSSQGFSRIHFLHLRLKTVSWRDAYTHLRKTTKAITLFLKERGTRVRHERRDAEICPSTFTWWHFNMYSRNALWFYVILRFDSQRIVFLVTR